MSRNALLDELSKFKPSFIQAYPSSAYLVANKNNHPKPKTLFNWGLPRSSGRWYWGLRKKQKPIIQLTSPTLAPFLSSGKL